MMGSRAVLVFVCSFVFTAEPAPTPPVSDRHIAIDGLVRLMEFVDVPARREGRIEKFEIKEGADIKRGQKLGHLDDAEASLTVRRTELEHQLAVEKSNSDIAIESAKLIQEVSQSEYQRARQAKQSAPNSISITEFERLRLESAKATNEVVKLSEEKRFALLMSQTKAVEMQLAKLAMEERQIIAPLDGIVVQLHRREGEWVNQGEKVIRVVRIDRLRVEGYVNLHSALATLEKAPAILEVEFPDSPPQQFNGEVVFMHPEADPVNGQIRIWAEIENRDRLLRPGQRGRLKLFPKEKVATQRVISTPSTDNKSR